MLLLIWSEFPVAFPNLGSGNGCSSLELTKFSATGTRAEKVCRWKSSSGEDGFKHNGPASRYDLERGVNSTSGGFFKGVT